MVMQSFGGVASYGLWNRCCIGFEKGAGTRKHAADFVGEHAIAPETRGRSVNGG